MPANPNRSGQGGDVEGETPNFVTQGNPIMVAKASFDGGYPEGALDQTLNDGGIVVNKADLVKGYCNYGKVIGEAS